MKRPCGKPTPTQIARLNKLAALGHTVALIEDPRAGIRIMEAML
jgi:hypothetical protein